MATDPDPLIEEVIRTRRERSVLVVAAVIGIVAGVMLGMAYALRAFSAPTHGSRSPAALIFFIGPLLVTMPIGYVVHAMLRRRRR